MAAKKWLAERWEVLLPAIAALGKDQESELQHLCEEELAAWRARPTMKSASALRIPLTDTRNKIKELPLTKENRWTNPRTRNQEHLALKYLNVTPEEWAAWNAPSAQKLQERMENVQLALDPEGIVATAVQLLQSSRWDEIAVGLAVTTGRRLSEVLKTGEFILEEPYTVIFAGQLKRKDKLMDPYEIPTLCEARLVIDAWQRLRQLQDCSGMDEKKISHDLGPIVSETADRYFTKFIPARNGHESLYTHLFRTIYVRIAWLYYGPDHVVDLKYMARIAGHYWILEATGQAEYDYQATMHYNDYRIADVNGKIDGRQGIKLGQPGVTVLKVYQQQKENTMATTKSTKTTKVTKGAEEMTSDAGKTEYSMIKPRKTTKQLYIKEGERLGITNADELLLELLKRSRLYDDMRAQQSNDITELRELLHEIEKEQPIAYLRELITRDKNFHAGLAKRHAGIDYRAMPLAELENYKTEGAAQERFRRAVQTMMIYNANVDEPLKRWLINANTIRDLIGGRYPAVKAYVEAHKEELDAHHTQFAITPVYNRKPYGIKEVITVSPLPDPDVQTPVEPSETEA
ncbi:protelomerase family protein [Dictyobacter arantiisoli]|uniref:Telomere resolvase ResT/TelK catalytic domain-containing protein n=1 Tax=Dictyobacter arantiisoli TaxID=2014874 RepID=A0A5A5TH64_9CHLR|nr:protelomerase family protein [Dictyobacter arantiisoli]GCF10910.1 hypothetical protein KDI_44740 [Dictyobacter arantiisoli]